MARRTSKSNVSDPYAIIVLIIVLVFSFLMSLSVTIMIYGPPIILFIGLLYYQIRIVPPPTLSADETTELSGVDEARDSVAGQLWKIKDEASRFDLHENSDKTYHRGSKRGVRLNKQKSDIDEYWSCLQNVLENTLTRVENKISIASLRVAFRCATAAYLAILSSLLLIRPAWLDGVAAFADPHILLRISGVDFVLYGAALTAESRPSCFFI